MSCSGNCDFTVGEREAEVRAGIEVTREPDEERRDPRRFRRRLVLVGLLLVALMVGGVVVDLTGGVGVEALFAPDPQPSVPTSQLQPVSGEERMPLPEGSLLPLGGAAPVDLADYRGKPLLINFWATWCVPCVTEMPILQEVSQQSRGQVTFLGVNVQDNEDKALAFLDELGVSYDQARDPAAEFFTEINGFGMPTTLLVNESGMITYRHTGAVEAQQLRDLLARHLGAEL